MMCQKCQEHEAAVHYKQVVNGEKQETHLCEGCAQEEGYMNFSDNGLSIHQFLTSMFPFDQSISQKQQVRRTEDAVCNKCGLSYQAFRRKGKFGCSNCYETFHPYLDPILKRVHSGNTTHVGKIPKKIGGNLHKQRELDQLRKQLEQLVQNENFEEAAPVRDQINKLKQELEEEREGGDQ
ncbi:UvrB/UvrC motif-containing protein [Halalkalibacillus halophilus]|uniref:UvrB/UvrC motif-containing protein n=1 Tax=Halalkalibacillus halophilus TaxID=392827 RepID=UPI00040F705B|nr:UvrB/UvrC motif-containing protein [Halalkalibacillus halophilus]